MKRGNRFGKLTAAVLMGMLFVQASTFALADGGAAGADINLALQRPYEVTSTIVDSTFRNFEVTSFPDNGTKLTDGIVGPSKWTAKGPWVGYLRQDNREIVLDLGDVQTIHKLDAWFLQDKGSGIYFPQEVTFALSQNGQTWSEVGMVPTAIPNSIAGGTVQDFSRGGMDYTARYVRMTFHTDIYVFLSEIQVWGQPGEQPGATKPQPTPPRDPQTLNFPLAGSKQAGGKKAETLIFSGYNKNTALPQWTVNDFLPYVAYVDPKGQIQDYLFDSFEFSPFGTARSGNAYSKNSTKADWSEYIDQLFTPNYRLSALNQAVEIAKNTLPNRNYQARVVISIPFPGINSNWGDQLDFNPAIVGEEQALANRTQAIQWYVDTVKSKWEAAGFSNLELNGFYWYNEGVGYSNSANDENLIRNAANLVHSAGPYSFDWIPAGQNPGFSRWEDYRFDTALMQPNYAFDAKLPADRLENNATLARKYGMGVEMEMHWFATRTDELGQKYRDVYYAYLDAAYKYHYQNSYLAWYTNTDSLLVASKSVVPEIRELYDQTYRFINGTYQPTYKPGQHDEGHTDNEDGANPALQESGAARPFDTDAS